MLLKVIRELRYSNERQTLGNLFVDNNPFCSTIEPPRGWASGPKRGNEIPKQVRNDEVVSRGQVRNDGTAHEGKKGCIPKGWYRVRVTYSPKFKRTMPLLCMVPGFEGIRIHAGMKVENTQGCICVGERWKEEKLTELLTKAQERNEEIYICITDSDSADGKLPKSANPDRGTFGY